MKFVWIIIILGWWCVSCQQSGRPDVNKLIKDRKIIRLDRDLFALDPQNPDVAGLHDRYGRYFETYTEAVLQLGNVADPDIPKFYSLFLRDSVIREVYDTVSRHYPDLSLQEKMLSQAWAYYSFYFPDLPVPQVYTHISGFNQSVVADSGAIGISLDNYLGNCVFYDILTPPIPRYARQKMMPLDIPRDVVAGWLNTEFMFRPKINDLISGMIYQGKIVYLLEKLFPDADKNYLLGFTREQWDWCKNNEGQIWGFLIENDYLFATQQKLLIKYLNDAPYTSGMPVESPGKTAVWSGYRIVGEYVKKTGVTPLQLMEEQDYHKIMKISGYRP